MSRKKQHPLIEAMNMCDRLSPEHQQLLLAYIQNRSPKPSRAGKTRTAATTEVGKKQTACATCGNPYEHPDHDSTYILSHPFALTAAAAKRVKRRSSPSTEPDSSTANTQTETATATSAGD